MAPPSKAQAYHAPTCPMTTLPLAIVFLLLDFVQALQYNVTVDDTDPRITYTGPGWTTCSENSGGPFRFNQSLLQGGASRCVHRSDNAASFNFTGLAVWVRGVLSISPSWDWRPPNVTFTLDGVEASLSSAILNDSHGLKYNMTFFQATGLSDGPHLLGIRTHDSSLFILDSITYTSSTLMMAVSSTNITDSSSPQSTSTEGQDDDTGSSSPHAAIVGGVIGGIFGAFLLAGLIGLLIIHNSRKQTSGSRSSRTRRRNRGAAPGSGGSSERRRQAERDRRKKTRDKVDIEFNYSGPKPVQVPWIPPVKESEPPRRGNQLSNYASSSTSEGGRTTELHHAITTDSLHPADRRTLESGARSKQETHHSTQTAGSTLDAEGVLEHVMNRCPPPEFSTRSPTRVIGDHPFRTRLQD